MPTLSPLSDSGDHLAGHASRGREPSFCESSARALLIGYAAAVDIALSGDAISGNHPPSRRAGQKTGGKPKLGGFAVDGR